MFLKGFTNYQIIFNRWKTSADTRLWGTFQSQWAIGTLRCVVVAFLAFIDDFGVYSMEKHGQKFLLIPEPSEKRDIMV